MVVINIHGSAYKIDFLLHHSHRTTSAPEQCQKKRRTQTT
jgi:hypothetical protein